MFITPRPGADRKNIRNLALFTSSAVSCSWVWEAPRPTVG